MRKTEFFIASFNRPNLFYEVRLKVKKAVLNDIGLYINSKQIDQTGLIYCISKKDTEKVSKYLINTHKISCGYYHADLSDKIRKKTQDN